MHQIQTSIPPVNLGQVIRDCQLKIATSYTRGGDSRALVALACSSITLQAYVEAGSLKPDALDHLAETTDNLGMPKRLGAEIVDIALDAGPMLYDQIADAWSDMKTTGTAVAA